MRPMSSEQESRSTANNRSGQEGAEAGALERILRARVRWVQRALSPWVQRWMSPSGGGAMRPDRHVSTALSVSRTHLLLDRVQRQAASAAVWRPDVGSLEPGGVDRFASAIVARFPDVAAKYGARMPEASEIRATDLVLAGERVEGSPVATRRRPSLATVQHELDEARARSAQPQLARPGMIAQAYGAEASARPTAVRVFSQVEEIVTPGGPPPIDPEESMELGLSVEGEAPHPLPAAPSAPPERKETPQLEPEAPDAWLPAEQPRAPERTPEPELEVPMPQVTEVQSPKEVQAEASKVKTPPAPLAEVQRSSQESVPESERDASSPPSADLQGPVKARPPAPEMPTLPLAEVQRPASPRVPTPGPEAPPPSIAAAATPAQRRMVGERTIPPDLPDERAAQPEPLEHGVPPGKVDAAPLQQQAEGPADSPTQAPAEETEAEGVKAPVLPPSAPEPEAAISPIVEQEPTRPRAVPEMPLRRQAAKAPGPAHQPQGEARPSPPAAHGRVIQTKPVDQTAVLPQVRSWLEETTRDAKQRPDQPPSAHPGLYTPPGTLRAPRGMVAPRQEREPEGLATDASVRLPRAPEGEGAFLPAATPVPPAVVQRQPDSVSVAGAASPPRTLDVVTGRDTKPERERSESELDDLARQVYPLLKRLLAVERERAVSRY